MLANGSERRIHAPGTDVTLRITAYDNMAALPGIDEVLRKIEARQIAEGVDRGRCYMVIPGVQGPGIGPNA